MTVHECVHAIASTLQPVRACLVFPLSEPNQTCENGELRLVNGRIPSEGRLEICYNSVWGTICHDGWENVEARVACTELGYPGNG